MPEIKIEGHLESSFPYILSPLEYIIGELLRNSVQAVVERHQQRKDKAFSGGGNGSDVGAGGEALHGVDAAR